jgi:predicted nuclease of restriction endonuclease-like (RecB) superfamily
MTKKPVKIQNDVLLARIGLIINESRQRTVQTVNTLLVITYWEIGREIVEHELGGKTRADYGDELLENLAIELTDRYGQGFSYRNLQRMKRFYLVYSIVPTVSAQSPEKDSALSHKSESNETLSTLVKKSVLSEKALNRLSWSHICLLLSVSDDDARSFYEIEIVQNNWSVRETKRQIESMLFERLALSRDKKGMLELSQQGQIIETPQDVLKDPYVLEFLGLHDKERWHESDLEQALMDHLQKFLLELGKGFMFVNRQMRITINNEHYRIDLVFYHKYLKSYILIDLKAGKFDHADYGQMKFYLNYFMEEMNDDGDNEPIGVILCYEKDEEFVKYVLKNEKKSLPKNTCFRFRTNKNYWQKCSGLKKISKEKTNELLSISANRMMIPGH